MANHDSNHSSKEKTILWVIAPATIAVSLLFTKLNHDMPPLREVLDGKVEVKKEVAAPKAVHAPAESAVSH